VTERTLGGINVFLPYIKEYVKTYMGHSITTTQWKDHLYSFFANQEDKIKALDSIDWNVSDSIRMLRNNCMRVAHIS
jgi:leukotriene-A4 hydrolase